MWALIVGVSPFLYAAIRLAAFSGGDRVLLVTVVRSLNVQGILIGSLAPLALSALVSLLYLYLIAPDIRVRVNATLARVPLLAVAAILLVILVVFLMPLTELWSEFGIYLGATLLFFVVEIVVRRVRGQKVPIKQRLKAWATSATPVARPVLWGQLLGVFLLVVLSLLAPDSMWLPEEHLTLTNHGSIDGYVVDNDAGWMTTITPSRKIQTFKSSTVIGRRICDQGGYQSLATIWAGEHQSTNQRC